MTIVRSQNEYEKIGTISSTTNNNQFVCLNILTSPANGDDDVFGDSALESSASSVLVYDSLHLKTGNDEKLPPIPFFFS